MSEGCSQADAADAGVTHPLLWVDRSPISANPTRRAVRSRVGHGPTLRDVVDVRTSGDVPAQFARAVETLSAATLRPELTVERIRPPQRLAPWSFALGSRVVHDGDEVATGRLVLLHDPAGYEAWDGTLRLVSYITAELDAEMAYDPLLPEVGWSWLLEALAEHSAPYTAVGGTVTLTTSTRFGDLAGPQATIDLELRASWTPLGDDLGPHARAWGDLSCIAAGLPPQGVAVLPRQPEPGDD